MQGSLFFLFIGRPSGLLTDIGQIGTLSGLLADVCQDTTVDVEHVAVDGVRGV